MKNKKNLIFLARGAAKINNFYKINGKPFILLCGPAGLTRARSARGARYVFTFHKDNLKMYEELQQFIGSGFFKTVYSLILTKQHLTNLGREEIKQIVANIRVRHNR
uniref:LAGLIDADG endonuclease n=1 Tax=Mucor indicus TaxID=64623 RepID=UPI002A802463|nr:LAGLIDADG endonuclease [Mucor indicus]WPA89410.1 LAGLIDADG endonuclease [Mucor indicus]